MGHPADFAHFLNTILDECLTVIFTNRLICCLNLGVEDYSVIKTTDYPVVVARAKREEEREDGQSSGIEEQENKWSSVLHPSWELNQHTETTET